MMEGKCFVYVNANTFNIINRFSLFLCWFNSKFWSRIISLYIWFYSERWNLVISAEGPNQTRDCIKYIYIYIYIYWRWRLHIDIKYIYIYIYIYIFVFIWSRQYLYISILTASYKYEYIHFTKKVDNKFRLWTIFNIFLSIFPV